MLLPQPPFFTLLQPFITTEYTFFQLNNPLNINNMTAKQTAIQDIKDDLKLQGKSFLAFRSELNTVMRKLVTSQIMKQKCQQSLFPIHCTRANSQLVAHCFFCKGKVELNNYTKYYENK